MGETEVSVSEEGAPKVQHNYLRVLLRRLRPEGFERHRVVKWPDCKGLSDIAEEATFIRGLKVFFLIILTLAVINLIIMFELLSTHHRPSNEASTWDYIFNQTWLFGHFQIRRRGIVLLAVFAAVLVVGVFMKKTPMKSTSSAPPKREQVQTISAVLQQV